MRFLKISIIILIVSCGNLYAQIDSVISNYVNDTVFRNAGISICIRDVESGDILASYNEDMALTSASVMKLVTTGTALEILHPDYRYSTRFGYVGTISNGTLNGYIVIKGGGDPALGSEYFSEHYGDFIDNWAKSIRKAGIKKIDGRVIADASIFAYYPAAPGWSWSDLGNYYGAGVHGLSVFDNTYKIYYNTGKAGSMPDFMGLEPEIPELLISNQLYAEGDNDRGYIYCQPYGNYAEIRGSIPVERDSFALKGSIPDPPLLLSSLVHEKLIELGIEITGGPTSLRNFMQYIDKSKLGQRVITCLTSSPDLSEIIKITNKESVNLFAETLAWTLDYETTGFESAYLEGGLQVIEEYLKTRGINTSGLFMTDGSGLSRSNALSSSFITSYLAYISRDGKYPELFKATLAVPGKGTFEPYFLAPEFKNNLRGKSGTVTRARNYAGYLSCKSGREISFGLLHNNFDCSSHQVSKRVEKLMLEVYESF